ncbi:MAG TPA: PQQ-dependent sugar dehydrogenase [Nitrososphaeraceae archaeon]|nr:PQQ-dependent sugar dehydrogenase [Nitrososphaeraceae archaeon]
MVTPAMLLIIGVVLATFYHEYDTTRTIFPSFNLTVHDLENIGGNIISVQKDPTGNAVSLVSGKWQFNKSAASTGEIDNASIKFESDLKTYNLDGISTEEISLSNFTLSKFNSTGNDAVLDGSVKLNSKDKDADGIANATEIPLRIVVSNKLIFNISSPSDLFQKHFQESPIYGKVTYSVRADGDDNKSSSSRRSPAISTQLTGGPVVVDPNLRVELVTDQISFPSKMAIIGDNDILILEKNEGLVKRVLNGIVQNDSLLDVAVANGVERGLLGIAVKKTNTSITHVFLYFTESVKDGDDVSEKKTPIGNRLYRYDLVNDKLVNPKLILDLPSTPGSAHNGGEILLDGKGNIYLTIGDLNRSNAKRSNSTITTVQNNHDGLYPDGRAGILRITEDGKAVGSGIIGNDHPLDKYFAYGVRNSFGMAFDPLTGKLWNTENGPEFGDEINLVEPGFNSGWNKVQGIWIPDENSPGNIASNFSGLVSFNGTGKYSEPELSWYQPSPGLTSLIFLNSTKLGSKYANEMLVSDFHNGNIYNFKLNNNRTSFILPPPIADKVVNTKNETQSSIFANGFGAIMDMEIGPDGYLYVLSLYQGGPDCDPIRHPNQPCVAYDKSIGGSLFKILPKSVVN